MARVCVFDVNETLLDLEALDPHFERVFGDASTRQAWFGQFLTSWLTAMVTGVYQEFGTIGGTALEMVAERQGVMLSDEDKGQILGGMQELPPHPEVEETLARLRDAGIRLAALTNSTQQVADAQSQLGPTRVLRSSPLRGRRKAPEARTRAVPYGRGEPGGGDRTGPPRRGPRLGRGGRSAGWMRGRVRGPAGDGPQPALRAPGHRRVGSARGRRWHLRGRVLGPGTGLVRRDLRVFHCRKGTFGR